MTFIRLISACLLLGFISPAASFAGALDGYNLEDPPETLLQFPKGFKEMSGLALTPDGRLFATEEKRAVMYHVNWREGAVMKTFTFGRPTAKGHFEGMAILGKRFFLITEKGFLVEGREGFEGEAKLFNEYNLELKKVCEISGLAAHTEAGKLLILCGKAKDKTLKDTLTIFSWDLATKKLDETPFLQVDLLADGVPDDLRKADPSGLALLPDGSGIIVLTTGKKFLIEIGFEGAIQSFQSLHEKRHKNPEGLAITQGGDLIIADEAGTLQLTVYPKGENLIDQGQHNDQG